LLSLPLPVPFAVSLLLLPVFGGRSGEHPREAGIYSLIGYQSRGVKAEEVSQTHRVLDVQVRKEDKLGGVIGKDGDRRRDSTGARETGTVRVSALICRCPACCVGLILVAGAAARGTAGGHVTAWAPARRF
jgi:hypothetical protein